MPLGKELCQDSGIPMSRAPSSQVHACHRSPSQSGLQSIHVEEIAAEDLVHASDISSVNRLARMTSLRLEVFETYPCAATSISSSAVVGRVEPDLCTSIDEALDDTEHGGMTEIIRPGFHIEAINPDQFWRRFQSDPPKSPTVQCLWQQLLKSPLRNVVEIRHLLGV